jgi:lipoate-protein ligase A
MARLPLTSDAIGAGLVLWVDGPRAVAEHMAIDAALLERAADPGRPVVLRLYTFAPPGITLGRAQDPCRELDLERCRQDGVDWAVRPTGGRAIFHAEDWTFSAAGPSGLGWLAGAPGVAYARTAGLVATALRRLGVGAELTAGTPGGPGRPGGGAGPAAPCFSSSARFELTWEGRKLAGIAQREVSGARLQQGTLLVGRAHLRLADYLAIAPDAREGLRRTLEAASMPLAAGRAAAWSFESFAAAVRESAGMEEVWRGDAPLHADFIRPTRAPGRISGGGG